MGCKAGMRGAVFNNGAQGKFPEQRGWTEEGLSATIAEAKKGVETCRVIYGYKFHAN